MRNILKLLLIFVILVVICAPCTEAELPAAKETDSCDASICALPSTNELLDDKNTVLSQDNWQFSVPGDGWELMSPPLPEIKIARENEKKGCLLFFLKEETVSSYGEYVIGTIRAFTEDGNTVVSAKQVVINSNKFIAVEVRNSVTTAWLWIMVKNGFGYGLSCGGNNSADFNGRLYNLCQSIADSVEIK